MATCTKVNSFKVKQMERVSINGVTVKFMMGNGFLESSKDMEFGREKKENPTSVNGKEAKPMVMECMSGSTVTGMKVNGRHV